MSQSYEKIFITTQARPSNLFFQSLKPWKPFLGTVNPTWSQSGQMGIHPQGGMPNQQFNLAYMSQNPQQQTATRSIYNAPLQVSYGPTGIPIGLPPQSYQYPEVNRKFPF
jgi:hypothetical protein